MHSPTGRTSAASESEIQVGKLFSAFECHTCRLDLNTTLTHLQLWGECVAQAEPGRVAHKILFENFTEPVILPDCFTGVAQAEPGRVLYENYGQIEAFMHLLYEFCQCFIDGSLIPFVLQSERIPNCKRKGLRYHGITNKGWICRRLRRL